MYGRSVGIVAVCALTATSSALVIPSPDSNLETLHEDSTFTSTAAHLTRWRRIDIPCHSCDFDFLDEDNDYDELSENGDDYLWIQGGARQLSLEFRISRDGRSLQLDGEPIFPSKYFKSSAHGGRPIYINESPAVDPSTDEVELIRLPLEVTAFGLTASESTIELSHQDTIEGNRILEIQFRVTSLEKKLVDADEVVIQLLRNQKGGLEIKSLTHVPHTTVSLSHPPPPSGPPPPPSVDTECAGLTSSMCRFRKIVKEKLASLRNGHSPFSRPCPGMRGPPSSHPHFSEFDVTGSPPHHHPHGPPHSFRPPPPDASHFHGPHHHHHHRHPHFLNAVARGAIAILIPVMAGITTGLLVSLVGLMIGRAVAFMWTRFFGRRQEELLQRCRCRATRGCRRMGEEEKMLADEADPPPVYEDAPIYAERLSSDAAAAELRG